MSLFSRSPNYRAHQSRTQRRRRLIVRGMPQLRQLLRHALRHHVQLALDLRQAVSDVVHQDLKWKRSRVRRGKVRSSPARARAILRFAKVQHLQQRDYSTRRLPRVVQRIQTVIHQQLSPCPTPVAHILTRLIASEAKTHWLATSSCIRRKDESAESHPGDMKTRQGKTGKKQCLT